MSIEEHVGKIVRKVDRKINVPEGVDENLYHSVQKITGEKYEPRLIGKGGEHLVFKFEDPKHPNTVYKVNYLSAASMLNAKTLGKEQEAKNRAYLDREILRKNHRIRELRDFFGYQAVPVQRYMIKDVPVNIDTIAKLMPNPPVDPANIPKEIPAWVTVQRKVDLPPDYTVSLNGYYPELRTDSQNNKQRKFYKKTGDLLLNCDDGKDTPEQQKESIRMLYDNLTTTDLRAGLDPEFKAKLQETVRALITYTKKTENALDLAGKNNIVLTKPSDEWELKLPDPLPNTDFTFDDLREAVKKLDNDRTLSRIDLIKCMNVLNTIRVINALAILADIPERLRVVADPNEIIIDADTEDEDDIDISFENPETGSLREPDPAPNAPDTTPRYLEIPVIPFLNSLSRLKKK